MKAPRQALLEKYNGRRQNILFFLTANKARIPRNQRLRRGSTRRSEEPHGYSKCSEPSVSIGQQPRQTGSGCANTASARAHDE